MNVHQGGQQDTGLHDAFEAMLADADEPRFPSVTDAAVAGGRRMRRRRRVGASAAGAVLVVGVLAGTAAVGLPDRAAESPADPPAPTGSAPSVPDDPPVPTPSALATEVSGPTGVPSLDSPTGTVTADPGEPGSETPGSGPTAGEPSGTPKSPSTPDPQWSSGTDWSPSGSR